MSWSAIHRGRLAAALALGLATLACATPPKPPALEACERLRADPGAAAAQRRAPDLVRAADRWLADAREKWQDNDIEDATHAALMGQIKLKHAMALAEQDAAKARIANADSELAKANEEYARIQRELQSQQEQIALLKRLEEEKVKQKKLAEQLSAEKKTSEEKLAAERQKATATEKLSEAELALKTADTVSAKQHAAVPYTAAVDMLARAQQEMQQANYQAAVMSAEFARKKADEAAEVAKPLYNQEAEGAESRARAEALARDAAAIPRIMVRRDARGSLQRLVLPLPGGELFNRRETTLAHGRDAILNDVAALIKKYPAFPVQVIGYTDRRGRAGELLALSLARAQSIYSALVIRGVDPKRMVVNGQGPADPIADNKSSAGRARNNRVEVVFLYQ